MSVKMILDDVAAEATAGLRIDLVAVRRQADQHRALVRRRATAAMAAGVAVAAVVTAIAVLLPGGLHRAVTGIPAVPTGTPTGLPDRWYYAPPWTPPVTRHPMAAASMLLTTPSTPAGPRFGGPVLVSADGTGYARLPWDRWNRLVSLAASGRDVAWVSQLDGAGRGPRRATVHRLHLADGHRRDVELPAGALAMKTSWEDDRLFVIVWYPATDRASTWVLNPGSDTLRATEAGSRPGAELLPQARVDSAPGDQVMAPFTVHDPSGTRTVDLIRVSTADRQDRPFDLRLRGGSAATTRIPISAAEPVTDAQILGWADGGIVVRLHTLSRDQLHRRISLQLITSDGTSSRVITNQVATGFYPVAVATEVVAAGVTVPGVQPTFSTTDRTHLWFLGAMAWSRVDLETRITGATVLITAVAVLVILRRRRRRTREPGTTKLEAAG